MAFNFNQASSAAVGQPMAPPQPQPVPNGTGSGIGDFLLGNGKTPGFFGGGQYAVDPNAYQLPGFAQQQQQSGQLANNVLAPTNQGQVAGQEQQLTNSLFGAVNGTQPSVAQQQLQQTTQGNLANAFAMAQANPNNPAAGRQLAEQSGQLNQQAAGQGALLRAQEINNAQGQLGNVLGQQQSQNLQANQVAQGYLGQQLQGAQAQQQGMENQQTAQQTAYSGAAANSLGGKVLGAAAGIGAAFAGKAQGGLVGGSASIPGNSNQNDTVPTMLSPGEVVLPRSVTLDKDAGKKAQAFVEAIRKKHALAKAA